MCAAPSLTGCRARCGVLRRLGRTAARVSYRRWRPYGRAMTDMRPISVLLAADVVEALEKQTNDVPQFVAEIVTDRVRTEADARRVRRRLIREELDRYEEEHGAFTEEELNAARARIHQALAGDPFSTGLFDR